MYVDGYSTLILCVQSNIRRSVQTSARSFHSPLWIDHTQKTYLHNYDIQHPRKRKHHLPTSGAGFFLPLSAPFLAHSAVMAVAAVVATGCLFIHGVGRFQSVSPMLAAVGGVCAVGPQPVPINPAAEIQDIERYVPLGGRRRADGCWFCIWGWWGNRIE